MKLLAKQFIGPVFKHVLIWTVVFHVVAFFVRDSSLEVLVLAVIGMATVAVAWKSLPAGMMIAFAEIFVGGHGHLLDADLFGLSVSLRMTIFAAVMLVWGIRFIKKDLSLEFVVMRDLPWLILFLAVALGTSIGFSENNRAQAFDDMNGFLTMAYLLPLISIKWTQTLRRDLLQVLFASAAWLVSFTLLLSYLFTHMNGKALNVLYRFVRDSRLAEITIQIAEDGSLASTFTEYYYRIFMQSQFFIVIALLLLLSGAFFMWRGQRLPDLASISIIGLISGLLLGMSRSFILGTGAGFIVIFIIAFFWGKKPIANIARRSVALLVFAMIAIGLVAATVIIPLPPNPDISDAAFYSSSNDTDREVAISSRWQLLGPMMDEIYTHPILGSGFGKEVTFITDDPRIRAINQTGEYTTYRFEWGYQDLWLKTGLLGLSAFALYALLMLLAIRVSAKKHGNAWIVVGLGVGLIALYVINIFSPYLNHPIGLMYMLFVIPFVDWSLISKKAAETIENARAIKAPSPKMSPAVSSEFE